MGRFAGVRGAESRAVSHEIRARVDDSAARQRKPSPHRQPTRTRTLGNWMHMHGRWPVKRVPRSHTA